MCRNCNRVKDRMLYLMEKELLHLKPFLVFDDEEEEDMCACGGPRRNDESSKRQISTRRLDPQPEGVHNVWFSSTQLHSQWLREIPHRIWVVMESQLSPDNVLRGPLLMGIGCSIPCISFVVRRITIFVALQGMTVLILVGVGACWFLLDVKVRARSLRNIVVATAQDRMQNVVLDDAMRQLFSPNYEGINLIRIVGMATAGSVLYMIPMVTLEHRLLLVQSALGLTREQAEALLCRPGGLQAIWNECNQSTESTNRISDVRSDRNLHRTNGEQQLPVSSTTATPVDCSAQQYLNSIPLSPLVADDQAPKLVASDETSSERSVDGSPDPLQFDLRDVLNPVNRSRVVDELPSRVNMDEVRLTRASHEAPPARSTKRVSTAPQRCESAEPSEVSTPWTVLQSIVVKHLSEDYVLPHLPRPPSEALLERCLTVSVGVLCIQLVCSRRARQLVTGAMQGTVIATSSAVATLSLSLIMLLYGVDPSDELSSSTNGLPSASTSRLNPSTSVEARFDHFSHAISRGLTRWARRFASKLSPGDVSWDSMRPLSSPPPLKSSLSGVSSAAISRLVDIVQKGWLTLEDHVARPLIHHAVQRRHSLSAFALILILARWKEERRRRLLRWNASGSAAEGYRDPLRRTTAAGRRSTYSIDT